MQLQMQQTRQGQVKSPLVFIGGAKGVGKTTLINSVNSSLQFPIFHTGEFYKQFNRFRQEDIDLMVYRNMVAFCGIIDGHYAGKNKDGSFSRGMQEKYLRNLALNRPELKFVLVTATLEEILQRKEEDNKRGKKQRDVSESQTLEELNLTHSIFDTYLKESGRKGLIINNSDNYFPQTKQKLMNYIIEGEYV